MRFVITAAAGLTLFLAIEASPTHAADPKAVACAFKAGSVHAFEKGVFKPEPVSPVEFEIVDINADAQSATLQTPKGATAVRVVRAVNALHFLEVVGEGFLNVTTVYDKDTAATRHPAVHSRHFGILGQPIVSHYQGFCATK